MLDTKDVLENILLPIILLILFHGMAVWLDYSSKVFMERLNNIFKAIFYLILALLTLYLNADENGKFSFGLVDELSLPSVLVLFLSVFEFLGNVIAFFANDHYKYVTREEFREYKRDMIYRKYDNKL